MGKRDLKADLELCNKATPGQWVICDWDTDVCGGIIAPDTQEVVIEAEDWDMPVKVKREDAEFMCQAREGWPHAIERALEAEKRVEELENQVDILSTTLNMYCSPYYDMWERAEKAEALARELVEALRRYEEWEASLLLEDGVWERNAGLPVFTQELYDSWMEIQDVRNEALIKAEEVLGDE